MLEMLEQEFHTPQPCLVDEIWETLQWTSMFVMPKNIEVLFHVLRG
jgi:hypothetical protein